MTVRGNSIVGNLGPTARSSQEGVGEGQRRIGVAEEGVLPHSCRTGALVGIARSWYLEMESMRDSSPGKREWQETIIVLLFFFLLFVAHQVVELVRHLLEERHAACVVDYKLGEKM